MKTLFIIIVISATCIFQSNSQITSPSDNRVFSDTLDIQNAGIQPLAAGTDFNAAMAQITPPSPEAASLGKFGQYPVSLDNGLVQIDIPIHTIQLSTISIPISLSYHASGIKVNEIPGVVGSGWALNAGGAITRSIRGLFDENITRFPWSVNYINGLGAESTKADNLNRLNNSISNGTFDSESDVYYYSFCGSSGSFRYSVDSRGIESMLQVPLSKNKIEIKGDRCFQVTTPDGTVYSFLDKETSIEPGSNRRYTSCWYLSTIKTTNNEVVTFNYKVDGTTYNEEYRNYTLRIPHDRTDTNHALTTSQSFVTTNNTILLSSITSPEGTILFSHETDRADRRKYRLRKISIMDHKNKQVKAFTLEQGYFTQTGIVSTDNLKSSSNHSSNFNNRLMLRKLILLDSRDIRVSNYDFEYNTSKLLPPYFYMVSGYPVSGYMGQDHWGYFNGVYTNKDLVYHGPLQTSHQPANRTPNPDYTQACVLNKITYPTGGYTEFKYENNKKTNGELLGGLRIKNIVSYPDKNSIPVVRSYEYLNPQTNFNTLDPAYTQGEFYLRQSPNIGDFKYYDYYSSEPILPLAYNNGSSVYYLEVIEYDGYPDNSAGKTHYTYTGLNDMQPYSIPEGIPRPAQTFKPRYQFLSDDRSWTRGRPIRIEVYKKENGIFSLIKKTEYEYTDLEPIYNFIVGFKTFAYYSNVSYISSQYGLTRANQLFQYIDVITRSGIIQQAKINETTYIGNNTVTQSTVHSYDPRLANYEIASTRQTNSDGAIQKTYYKYPKDFSSTEPYRKMIQLNMISTVTEQIDSVNNKFIQSVKPEYREFGSGIIAPASVTVKNGANASETEITYSGYDSRGNILSVYKRNGINEAFIWGYGQTLLTAKMENIAYTAVESNSGLKGYLTQLENFSSLKEAADRDRLQTLNQNIRNSLPANVLATTYTYMPLVGMTSSTNPSGVTTYYDYDSFGQLQDVYIMEDKGGVKTKKSFNTYTYNYSNR